MPSQDTFTDDQFVLPDLVLDELRADDGNPYHHSGDG
jgi:hypothetical protein